MNQVTLAFDANNHLGETPYWSVSEQALWWVNCEQPPELHRWSPTTGDHRVWPMPQRIGGFAQTATGGMLVALADGIYNLDLESGALRLRARSPLPAHVKLHESAVDRQGRLWIGAYDHHFPADRNAAGGSYFRLDGDTLTPMITGISIANGLAFSPDGATLYAADAIHRSVFAFDLYGEEIANRRTFLTLSADEGFIDGATVDSDGGYWLATVAAGALRRYFPDGTLDRIVPLPFSNPTKPCFGGPDFKTLYVTSTRMAIPAVMVPSIANGGIFSLIPGETGLAELPVAR
jgi:L-arabinonolactonase